MFGVSEEAGQQKHRFAGHRHTGILQKKCRRHGPISVMNHRRPQEFENGVAQGIDYSFSCSDQVMTSSGYETYPAKWKKKDEELIILMCGRKASVLKVPSKLSLAGEQLLRDG